MTTKSFYVLHSAIPGHVRRLLPGGARAVRGLPDRRGRPRAPGAHARGVRHGLPAGRPPVRGHHAGAQLRPRHTRQGRPSGGQALRPDLQVRPPMGERWTYR